MHEYKTIRTHKHYNLLHINEEPGCSTMLSYMCMSHLPSLASSGSTASSPSDYIPSQEGSCQDERQASGRSALTHTRLTQELYCMFSGGHSKSQGRHFVLDKEQSTRTGAGLLNVKDAALVLAPSTLRLLASTTVASATRGFCRPKAEGFSGIGQLLYFVDARARISWRTFRVCKIFSC